MAQNQHNQDPKFLGRHPKRPTHAGTVRRGKVTALVEKGEMADANSDNRNGHKHTDLV